MSVKILEGDCVSVMSQMLHESIDAIVTDPPYHFTSIVKRFGADGAAPAKSDGATGVYERSSRGFMGKTWDGGDIAFRPETWAAALRVLKPGGHLVAFGAPKNYHRLACAIEDAGFEVRDALMWVFGSGFPKSHNLHDGWEGWGTALKPAYEPIILARKPLIGTVAENVLAHGTGAINIDACRVGDEVRHAAFTSLAPCKGNALGAAGTQEARRGTQGEPKKYVGRWPANLVHDGSDEVLAAFPTTAPSKSGLRGIQQRHDVSSPETARPKTGTNTIRGVDDAGGSAARFFYCAKASKNDRAGSKHPTVKPLALMRWLVRMVTPPGGVVLDPFAGSGTTGAAAEAEGFDAVLIEREAEYLADIRRRLGVVAPAPSLEDLLA